MVMWWVVQGDDVVVQGLTVCKMPGSHTVPVVQGLTVCAKLDSHTDDVVV